MSAVSSVGTWYAQSELTLEVTAAPTNAVLSDPRVAGFVPSDAVSELMASLQRLGEASLASSEIGIQSARESLREQLDSLLTQLREAAERMQQQKKEHESSWFGDALKFVGEVIGKITGTIVDFAVDAVWTPFEMTVAAVEHFGDRDAMYAAIRQSAAKLTSNGATAQNIEGFSSGVSAFAGDLADASLRLTATLAQGLLEGDLGQRLSRELSNVWGSLETNVIDNPDFWAVSSAIAKGLAMAAAVVGGGLTGGALLVVGVALLVLLEADERTGIIQKTCKEAAPWVRMGIEVGAALCLACAGGGGGVDQLFSAGTAAIQAGGGIYRGVRTIQHYNALAREVDAQADIQETTQHVHSLQRLLDRLLEALSQDAKDQEQIMSLGTDAVAASAAADGAVIAAA